MTYTSTSFSCSDVIPPESFIGRRQEIRRIGGRILNRGQSSAIVGEPRMGKTSLLHYITQAELYGKHAAKLFYSYVDIYNLESFDQAAFWKHALEPFYTGVIAGNADARLTWAYQTCAENAFEFYMRDRLFAHMAEAGYRLVLLIDEFDNLAGHPDLNSAEFFGGLRSQSTRTSALTLVITARCSLVDLNKKSQGFDRGGSPYFNFFDEITLGAFPENDVLTFLSKTPSCFTGEEHRFIRQIAGGHPCLLQAATSFLWDAHKNRQSPEQRKQTTLQKLSDKAAPMLADSWRDWSPKMRMAMTVIALTQAAGLVPNCAFGQGELLDNIRDLGPELRVLEARGFIAREKSASPAAENLCIQPKVFLIWLAEELTRTAREEKKFDEWLRAHELVRWGFLTKQKKEQLITTGLALPVKKITNWLLYSALA